MSSTLPKPLLGWRRSSFTLIDPSTQLYYRKFDLHGWLNNSTRQHIAISYVWSEWIDNDSEELPNWDLLRRRLLCIIGKGASKSFRSETGNATRCWLDSRCVDQTSASSKSYWIPRMDEIYAEAKCTVLLLRDSSIYVLVPVAQSMKCNIKSKAKMFDWPHSCLLSQCCTTFPEMPIDQEMACVRALERLYDGPWRKRAWIFQEILLSKKYLLSIRDSDFIELGDLGVMANLLFQRHPNEMWLGKFSDWCRRLFYLRHFFAESTLRHLSEANVLQMATGLEASVPADKIYALCGILRLKNVPYNNKHTADEAFQVVVQELVRKGRLSWLYAVPPPLNDDGFCLDEGHMTPFVLTRMSDRLVANRNKTHVSSNLVGFPVMCVGQITRTKSLAEVLEETHNWKNQNGSAEFPQDLEYLSFVPKIIRRIALDVVNPLLLEPLFGQICLGLGISLESGSRPTRAWRMIMSLFMMNLTMEVPVEGTGDQEEQAAATLAWSAARSLQERLKVLQHEFLILWWNSDECSKPETIGLGPRACTVGNYVCSMKDDDQLRVAASFEFPDQSSATKNVRSVHGQFRGMIYDLNTVMTMQWRVKVFVFHLRFAPIDMQGPVFGDHPYWDGFKDQRYDKYIKTGASKATTLFTIFGKIRNQAGKPVFLNLAYNVGSSKSHVEDSPAT